MVSHFDQVATAKLVKELNNGKVPGATSLSGHGSKEAQCAVQSWHAESMKVSPFLAFHLIEQANPSALSNATRSELG